MDILRLRPELILENQYKGNAYSVLMFWLPAVIIFFIGNTSIDWCANIINLIINDYIQYFPKGVSNKIAEKGVDWIVSETMSRIVIPSRASLYFFSCMVLALPIIANVRKNCIDMINKHILYRALKIFLLLALLVFYIPISPLAKASLNPFGQSTGFFYRRVFSIALAYFTHLNGYVLFPILSCLIMYAIICAIIILCEQRNVYLSNFQCVSIFSSGLIIHYFHMLGSRPECFVFLFALLSLMLPLSKYGRATLIVLMFSTHEAAALCISMPLILFVFPKNERNMSFIIIVMYFLLWLLNFQFDVRKAIEAQALISNKFAYEGITETPLRIIGGIFFSYKILWCFIPVALYYFIKNREYVSVYKVLFAVLFPVFQIFLAYDTSRLISFGYLGIICAVIYSYCYMPRKYFNLALSINLLIPSYDVGVWGFNVPKYGLYKIFHMLLM